MAVIKSGASSDQLTIDAVAKAARVTLYESDGSLEHQIPLGSYFSDFYLRCGVITAGAGVAVWAMRNGSSRTVRLQNLILAGGFTGTAAATESVFTVKRFSTATPTGGVAITPNKKDTTMSASAITDMRDIRGTDNATAGLTTAGVVFEPAPFIQSLVVPHQNVSVFLPLREFGIAGKKLKDDLVLNANEGLAVVLEAGNTVAGAFIQGLVEWREFLI